MRNLTLKQLRGVSAIGSSRRIVTAAKELGLTPPAITLQLQQIETEVGLRLFDRTTDGLLPTEAGLITMETAAQISSMIAAYGDRLAALKGLAAGHISVGVVSTAKYFAPRLIAGFAQTHSGIEVRLSVGNREEVIGLLRDFQIDVAIMGRPPKDLSVDAIAFGNHPLVIIAPPDHRLAKRRRIPKADLSEEVFLIREEGSGTRISMEIYLAGMALRTGNLKIESGSNETIKQAVMAGLGIAFISAHTVEAELESGRLVLLNAEGMPVQRKWFGVRRRDKEPMPASLAFFDFLSREGRRFLPLCPCPPTSASISKNR